MPIQGVNPGEPLLAERWNELVEALNRLDGLAGSGGGSAGGAGGSVVDRAVALMLSSLYAEWFVPVIIEAVLVDGQVVQSFVSGQPVTPLSQTYFPSRITYNLRGARKGFRVGGVSPVYGRPVRGDEAMVYPAAAGMVALLERGPRGGAAAGRNRANLMLLPDSEVVARKLCSGNGAALLLGRLGRKARDPLLAEPEPLPLPLPFPPPPSVIEQDLASAESAAKGTGGGVAGGDAGDGSEGTGGGTGQG